MPQNPRPRKHVEHFEVPGHAHFLTFSCYRRLPLLGKDRTRHWFVEALDKARTACDFDLWAWVVMPEHVHLLIRPNRPVYRMAAILSAIKRPVGLWAMAYLRQHAPVFLDRLKVVQGGTTRYRFWQAGPGVDRNLWDPKAVHEVIEYIHTNPVRRGLVLRPEDWPWSSAADWMGRKGISIRVNRTVPLLNEWIR